MSIQNDEIDLTEGGVCISAIHATTEDDICHKNQNTEDILDTNDRSIQNKKRKVHKKVHWNVSGDENSNNNLTEEIIGTENILDDNNSKEIGICYDIIRKCHNSVVGHFVESKTKRMFDSSNLQKSLENTAEVCLSST